tara:strand:+ start:436 stop:684 length:249 start_codon:yes stop_codon:yes gene_type:complete
MGGAMGGSMGGTMGGSMSASVAGSSSLTTRLHDQNPQHNETELHLDLNIIKHSPPNDPMINAILPAISLILKSANCPIFILY